MEDDSRGEGDGSSHDLDRADRGVGPGPGARPCGSLPDRTGQERAGIAKSTLSSWNRARAIRAWRPCGDSAPRSACRSAGWSTRRGRTCGWSAAGEGPITYSERADYAATLLASCPPQARRDIYRIASAAGRAPGPPTRTCPGHDGAHRARLRPGAGRPGPGAGRGFGPGGTTWPIPVTCRTSSRPSNRTPPR